MATFHGFSGYTGRDLGNTSGLIAMSTFTLPAAPGRDIVGNEDDGNANCSHTADETIEINNATRSGRLSAVLEVEDDATGITYTVY